MDIPALKLPQEDYSLGEVYTKKENAEEGFGKALREIIEEQDRKGFDISYRAGTSLRERAEIACKKINDHHQQTRRRIDEELQTYLLYSDGVVGYWHDSVSGSVISWKDIASESVNFDYFGDEYEISGPSNAPVIRRKSNKFIYRNTYKAPDAPEYIEIKKEEDELRKEFSGTWGISDVIISLVSLLVVLLGGFACFAFIAEICDSGFVEGTLRPLLTEWAAKLGTGRIQVMLEKLFSFLLIPADKLSVKTFSDLLGLLISAALAFVPTIFGAMIFLGGLIQHSSWKKYKKFIKSRRYQDVTAKNKAHCEQDQALSDEWHRAWFEWVKANKHHAGELALDFVMQQIKDTQESHNRATIKEELGIDIPEGISAADWMQRLNKGLEEKVAQMGKEVYGELSPEDGVAVMHEVLREMVDEGMI